MHGSPSVLFDSVAILVSTKETAKLANDPGVRDFISDAYAHLKYIAYSDSSLPLIEKTVMSSKALDERFIRIRQSQDSENFI